MIERKAKSNRAQADYFELLVMQYIDNLYNIYFPYNKELIELSKKILFIPGGEKRLKLQQDNLIKIQSKIIDILNHEIKEKGKILDVLWVGRKLLIKTTSDIDIEHISNIMTRFSVKSIEKMGTGTLKNIGMRQLKIFLDIDFSEENNKMWKELRTHLNDYISSQLEIKEKAHNDSDLLEWATVNGKIYQAKLNELCLNSFNELPLERKINFLNYITDCNDENLYVLIANSSGALVYKPVSKNLELIKKIEAKNNSVDDSNKNEKENACKVGYTVFVDDIPFFRVQTNNTNGIGISAFCQRIFLIDKSS